jgi:hypothetical protein
MQKPLADLDRLTTLLSQCLGRIDDQIVRMHELREDAHDFLGDVLEGEAATLQELIDSLIEHVVAEEQADLNRAVAQGVTSSLAAITMPVVVRQQLAPDLPRVGCGSSELAFALQRTLSLVLGQMRAGGELVLQTRLDGEGVVLEVTGHDVRADRHLPERTTTLCEFVAQLDGHCEVHEDRGSLRLSIELPRATVAEES